eukprot:14704567-Heterocapsa_arctica.AAC.1
MLSNSDFEGFGSGVNSACRPMWWSENLVAIHPEQRPKKPGLIPRHALPDPLGCLGLLAGHSNANVFPNVWPQQDLVNQKLACLQVTSYLSRGQLPIQP